MAGFLPAWSPAQRIVGLALAALCIVLVAVIFGEMNAPLETAAGASRPAAASARQAKAEALAPSAMPPLQRFSAVTERPLFSPSRRPPLQAADDSEGAWSSFTLAGIIITPDSREALIRHGSPPTIAHLHEGQDLEGWVVRSILPDRVVFAGGDTQHELRLMSKPPASTPASGPSARRSFR
ncbi:MAG TPA: hypothetical protein VJR47_19975 [Stellaceae bacterium]|nr:hypothetical protein [Stellaceae bacterium]